MTQSPPTPTKVNGPLLQDGIKLGELFETSPGQALLRTLEESYLENLSAFTKEGMTKDEVWEQYNVMQGLLSVLAKIGEKTSYAMLVLTQRNNQQMAKVHVQTAMGVDPNMGPPS